MGMKRRTALVGSLAALTATSVKAADLAVDLQLVLAVDGRTNDGPPAELVRDKLVAQGIVINGLPVMMNRTNFGRPPDLTLDKYYEENVIGGPGAFMIVADNFEHFGRAVRNKLVRE